MPTLFEKIISGELPANIIYRDPRVVAFLDIRPAAPVHILVVPNKVIPTTDDIADEDEKTGAKIVLRADTWCWSPVISPASRASPRAATV